MVNNKIYIVVYIIFIFINSCSTFHNILYIPDITQGNYFTEYDISKIYIGMTKEQMIQILGTAMIQDPFGSNTWYYIYRYESPKNNKLIQKTLIAVFDEEDILVYFEYKPKLY